MTEFVLGGSRGQRVDGHRREPLTLRRHRVVAAMRVAFAADALFLNVSDLSRAGNVAVPTNHTAARQRREPQYANDAHRSNPLAFETKQLSCRTFGGHVSWGSELSWSGRPLWAWPFLHTGLRLPAHTFFASDQRRWIEVQRLESEVIDASPSRAGWLFGSITSASAKYFRARSRLPV